MHASKTEEFLNGKVLLDSAVVQEALSILESELKPDHIPPDATPEYRQGLALSLLYKVIINLSKNITIAIEQTNYFCFRFIAKLFNIF